MNITSEQVQRVLDKDQRNRFENHSSLIKTQTKKKRSCLTCRKIFMSNSAGHRTCDICSRARSSYGERAYIAM